jgi:hypothetical protein
MGLSVVLLGDQLPVPSQRGLRRDDAGDLGKNSLSQRFGLYGQSPMLVIEAHSPVTELFWKHSILLAKIFNDLGLAAVHPAGNSDPHKPEWSSTLCVFKTDFRDQPSRSTEPPHPHANPLFGPRPFHRHQFLTHRETDSVDGPK